MASVSAIQHKLFDFLLNSNVRLNGLTTLVKSFDAENVKQRKNLFVENKKKSLLDIQLFSNRNSSGQNKGIRSLFSNINSNLKGNFVDMFA